MWEAVLEFVLFIVWEILLEPILRLIAKVLKLLMALPKYAVNSVFNFVKRIRSKAK